MLKKDVVKKFQEVASRVDKKFSQDTVSDILDILGVTMAECYKELEVGEKAPIGEIMLEKKKVEETTRKCSLPGKEGEYTVPAHTKPVVKLKTKFVNDNKVVIK